MTWLKNLFKQASVVQRPSAKPNPAATADLVALQKAIELLDNKLCLWRGGVSYCTEEGRKLERIRDMLRQQYKEAVAYAGE